jgi:hypothetical protein
MPIRVNSIVFRLTRRTIYFILECFLVIETEGKYMLHRTAQNRRFCRGHHREAHRSGDEAAWWRNLGIDPTVTARALWLKSHPLLADSAVTHRKPCAAGGVADDLSLGGAGANDKTKPIPSAASQ